jgi:hypothetical protein
MAAAPVAPVIPPLDQFHDFFVASVGAAAALMGLLFVAITISKQPVFGSDTDLERRILATRAFIGLGNVFFVSLGALIPHGLHAIAVVAALSIVQVVREGIQLYRRDPTFAVLRKFGLLSLTIFALELFFAIRLESGAISMNGIVDVVMGLYAYSLLASWTLMGARD